MAQVQALKIARIPQTRVVTEAKTCPSCKSEDLLVARRHTVNSESQACAFGLLEPGDEVEFKFCHRCGLIFKSPRWSDATLTDYYSKVCPANEVLWQPKDLSTNPVYDRRRKKRFEINCKRILQFAPSIKSIVDVGGQSGEALLPFLAKGIECFVVDPGASQRKPVDNRIKSFESLAAFKSSNRHVDFVMSLHTLEHVPKPHEFLSSLLSLLAPNGNGFVEVPYDLTELPFIFDRALPESAIHAEHINFFSSPSLVGLARHCGVSQLKVKTILTMQKYGGYVSSLGLYFNNEPAPQTNDMLPPIQALDSLRRLVEADARYLRLRRRFVCRWYSLQKLDPA